MKSIAFPEVTNKIAENQPEYNTVHSQWNPYEQSVNMCFSLEIEEVQEIVQTGKIWVKQVTFGKPMNPILISPFKDHVISETKEIGSLNDIDTTTPEGKLLFSAIIDLTRTIDSDKTPEEVLEKLKDIKNTIKFL